jgi:hypothetical protein
VAKARRVVITIKTASSKGRRKTGKGKGSSVLRKTGMVSHNNNVHRKTGVGRASKGRRRTGKDKGNNVHLKIGMASSNSSAQTGREVTDRGGNRTGNNRGRLKIMVINRTGLHRDLIAMKKKNNELIK